MRINIYTKKRTFKMNLFETLMARLVFFFSDVKIIKIFLCFREEAITNYCYFTTISYDDEKS